MSELGLDSSDFKTRFRFRSVIKLRVPKISENIYDQLSCMCLPFDRAKLELLLRFILTLFIFFSFECW
jgi:hypothetical protein